MSKESAAEKIREASKDVDVYFVLIEPTSRDIDSVKAFCRNSCCPMANTGGSMM